MPRISNNAKRRLINLIWNMAVAISHGNMEVMQSRVPGNDFELYMEPNEGYSLSAFRKELVAALEQRGYVRDPNWKYSSVLLRCGDATINIEHEDRYLGKKISVSVS